MEQAVYEQLLEKENALQGDSDSLTINCFFNSVRQTDQNEETVATASSAQEEEWTELQNVDMSNIDELSESSARDAVDTHLFSEAFQSLSPSEDVSTDMDLGPKAQISVDVLSNFQEGSSAFTQLRKQRAELSMRDDMEEVEEEVEVEGDEEEEEEEEIEVEEGEEEEEEVEEDEVEEDDDDDDDENMSSSSVPVTPPSTAGKIDNWLIDKEVSEHRNGCYVLESNKSSKISAVDKSSSKLPSETPWGFSVRDAKEDSFCQLQAHRKKSLSLEMTVSRDDSSSESDEPSDQSILNTKLAQNAGSFPPVETTGISASVQDLSRTLSHGLLTAAENTDHAHNATKSVSEGGIFTSGASYMTLPTYRERKPTSDSQEHLSKSIERMQSGHWISEICQSSHSDTLESPSLKDKRKPSDVGANLSPSQEQALRENLPIRSSQTVKEAVNPYSYIQKLSDNGLAQRKTVLTETELSSRKDNTDCMLGSETRETSIDVSGRNRHWNLGNEKEMVPISIRNDPISSKLYGTESTPYITSVVVHEKKEDGDCTEEEKDFVFTCIECSIYFKKKEHLIEHMQQHNQTQDKSGTGTAGQSQYSCTECGWIFGDTDSLEQHQRLHQESRERFMEEIQKLNNFTDEGRDAKLQCSKCLFGTNCSRTFAQHCKTHSKDKKHQEWNADLVVGASQDQPDSPIQNVYMHSGETDFPSQPPMEKSGNDCYTCTTCSFSTASESVLTEHIKYRHTDHSQENDVYKENTDFPSTSKDSFSLPRTNKFEDAGFTSTELSRKTDNASSSVEENQSIHENITPFPKRLQRASKSFRIQRDVHSSLYQKTKPPGYFSTQKKFGNWSFHSADGYYHQHPGTKVHYGVHRIQGKGALHQTVVKSEDERKHQMEQVLERQKADSRLKWSSAMDAEGREGDIYSDSDKTLAKRSWRSFKVPQTALELKKDFSAILRKADSFYLSDDQQHQIRNMVPIVVLDHIDQTNPSPQPVKGWKRKLLFKRRRKRRAFGLSAKELMKGYHPSEFDLPFDDCLDPSLLSPDSPLLKNEEKKCPYCPDKFHNGIGLANHIRGHLNRVGVSYNVRHFISADEVKAIEQKFSFQKKKKKVANFDPETFSLMRCEFCGAGFDTRAGLSSHARAHLRDFGITNWEVTISPINILKKLLSSSSRRHLGPPKKKEPQSPLAEGDAHDSEQKQAVCDSSAPASPSSLLPSWVEESGRPEKEVMDAEDDEVACEVGSTSNLKRNTMSPQPELDHSTDGSKPSSELQANKTDPEDKPMDGDDSEIVCRLCGAWFETRKGLSSHSRAHLRHFGVADPDSKGSPIVFLNELIKNDDFRKKALLLIQGQDHSPSASGGTGGPSGAINTGGMKSPSSESFTKESSFSSVSPPPAKSSKPDPMRFSPGPSTDMQNKGKSSSESYWAAQRAMSPLNLSADAEPDNDVRCSFCGEFFENKKGLSSHSRSHLRQMGVTEWYMNGSPIETLKDVVKRRTQARGASVQQGQKTMTKPQSGSSGLLDQRVSEQQQQQQSSIMTKKFPQARSPDHPHSGSPTARKMFPGLPPPSLQKKLKPDSVRIEFKRDISGSVQSEHQSSSMNWSTQNELSPLNLSAGPNPDTRCMFCGEYFENKKGLSSHARSHLRQMGVTEWSVNGSPIDTLRELVKKKSKTLQLKKESPTMSSDPSKRILEDRPGSKSPVKIPPGMTLSPIGGRIMKSNLTISSVNREHSLTAVSKKTQMGFMTPMPTKRPMLDERFLQSEPKQKSYVQTELPFRSKSMSPEKITSPSPDASCELCGLCFENRKALASHARAHLRQFGVTEWCVNGSPIETLSEWIKRKPQKAGAYRSYIQGGHAFMKKFRAAPIASEHGEAGRKLPSSSGGFPGTAKAMEKEMPTSEVADMMDFNSSSDVRITSPSLLREPGTPSQRHNINKFERRQAKMSDFSLRDDEVDDFRSPSDEIRSTSQKVKTVPSLLPRPPQTSLVKFVGNIYTLKCRFCEVEFHGPLSIQEDWVRHLQRHILNMSVSKADALRSERAASDMHGVTDGYQHS
ncbi:protein Wiz isoform X2 [Protopterus annectens]|uniref:protein Wiz isoform X2 n=1 Tax=Protopterus annectens TaxID=7888 RepID=UPI001CFA7D24|nr:protein Wiz isoform X2 [Protopterus annectens]